MAKGKFTGGRHFKKGQVSNPDGRPKLPPELKEARKVRKEDVEKLLHELLYMESHEIEKKLKDPKSTILELMLCKVATGAINKSDQAKLQFLLDRSIGPITIKTETKVTGNLYDQLREELKANDKRQGLETEQSLQDKEQEI